MNAQILKEGKELQERIEYLKRQLKRLEDYEFNYSDEKFSLSYGSMSVMINPTINRIIFSIVKADLQDDLAKTEKKYENL